MYGSRLVLNNRKDFYHSHRYQQNYLQKSYLKRSFPLKFVEVDEEQSRLILSNRKAMADSQAQLGIGLVVTGTVQSLKPYGAFIDIGGINGLLHVSQISHDRVSDIATVLQPGDELKAEEMAQTFRQRIAQAEAMARADMLKFQPESGLSLSATLEKSPNKKKGNMPFIY